MKKYMVWVALLLVILTVGCALEDSPITVKEKVPDIRVTATNIEKGFSLSEGAYASGTYTLTNYGDADGYATVSFKGDISGVQTQQTILVRAQVSTTNNIRLDITNDDSTVDVRVINQRKA